MIENMTTELTMLGTGNATVTKCYNTCFTIKTGKNILLVDAGGGNGILGQLEKAGIAISEIHDMFVTHAGLDLPEIAAGKDRRIDRERSRVS